MAKRVICVAAHPDDEVLFAGGAMARHAAEGDLVRVLILAEGATSRGAPKSETEPLQRAALAAAQALGVEGVTFGGLPDQKLDQISRLEIVQMIEAALSDFQPDTIYTHHGGDLNLDHQIVHQAVMTAARPLPGSRIRAIYAGETLSSTEWAPPTAANAFVPQHHVDISGVLDRKLAALDAYVSEMRDFPHARSLAAVTSLAQLRGAQVGYPAVESFMVMRSLWA